MADRQYHLTMVIDGRVTGSVIPVGKDLGSDEDVLHDMTACETGSEYWQYYEAFMSDPSGTVTCCTCSDRGYDFVGPDFCYEACRMGGDHLGLPAN